MGVSLWGDLSACDAQAGSPLYENQEVFIIDGYYQKYEPKASRRSRESGGVSARRGPKVVATLAKTRIEKPERIRAREGRDVDR